MRSIVFMTFMMFLLMWLCLLAYLTGYIPQDLVPANLTKLTLPTSTTQLGDSLAVLDGLFTSIAIVLGLVAILLQGRELKESTKAQTEQAHSLSIQIGQQEASNRLGAFGARLQFLLTEADRLDTQVDSLIQQVETESDTDKKTELWNIIKNSRNKQSEHRNQAKEIDGKIQQLLEVV